MDADFDARQLRGGREAYERYLQGMDASMRQKVALTAAHLLCIGRVADMGMGSGQGSHALAALHPWLRVVGVDLDPNMVEIAREKFVLPNLEFVVGDIAEKVFEDDALEGVLDSSVLHHVTSFGGYRHDNAARALEVQARALRVHGTLIVRDFVAPEPSEVFLDVRHDDGDDSDDPRKCSTAALLERFAREFRSLHAERGFQLARETSDDKTYRRYRLSHRHAVEFVLRKDYRTDWESEAKEEYTYFTQAEFDARFASLGMRVLASTPLYNPWIVRHRFEDKFRIVDVKTNRVLPFPPTNTLVVGEKVGPGEGVRFREGAAEATLGFLEMTHYRDRRDGKVRDLVRRPNTTLDVIPWFTTGDHDEDLFVVARMSYPRPILASARQANPSLDAARAPHYVTEPLNVLQTDRSLGETVERMLESYARIAPVRVRGFLPGATYYPSPGGTQEEVRSVLVEIDPMLVQENVPNVSGFSTSGRVRAMAAEQVLRAAQVGGLPDARLELAVYDLLLARGRAPGPWLGEELVLRESDGLTEITDFETLRSRPLRRAFERVDASASHAFLELACHRFEELDASGIVVASSSLEYVAPSTRSLTTVACALLARRGDAIFLGLDDDDIPAAQCFVGNSQLLVAPAWRLPNDVRTIPEARTFVAARLLDEYDATVGTVWDLGGRHHPSAGLSPEVVYPMAVEVLREGPRARPLKWIPLSSIAKHREDLREGHLRIVALRAAHALGLLR